MLDELARFLHRVLKEESFCSNLRKYSRNEISLTSESYRKVKKKRKTPMRSLDELLIFTNSTFYKSKRNLAIVISFSVSSFPLTNAKRAQIFVTISHFMQLVSLLSLSKRRYNRAIWFVVQFPHCSTRMIWIRPTISMSIDLSSISTWYDIARLY